MTRNRVSTLLGLLAGLVLLGGMAQGAQRFPPPEFESGYHLPGTTTPPARSLTLEYLDAGVLLLALGLATWLVYGKRSRRGLVFLGIGAILYFGFFRLGCVCAIGSVQNVALALADPGYAIPLSVLAFFVAPLVVSLFAGRVFCAGVCPHGALQDLILIKPVKVPAWLENGLSVLPFLYLAAAVVFAATGTSFIICRYDPFIALFRMSGSFLMVLVGVAFLILGLFVGRPYCRFLCPYGALLKLGSKVSKWRVRVTPDVCTQCRLCEESCPFGVMREPTPASLTAAQLAARRRRLGWLLVTAPLFMAAGAWIGSVLSAPASRVHPTVALAETWLQHQESPIATAPQTAPALALQRASQNPAEIFAASAQIRRRFELGGLLFGIVAGLVIALKLIALTLGQKRADYEPDHSSCYACARCFPYCPNEQVRLGLTPATANPAGLPAAHQGNAVSNSPPA